jgi:hypothetical protein
MLKKTITEITIDKRNDNEINDVLKYIKDNKMLIIDNFIYNGDFLRYSSFHGIIKKDEQNQIKIGKFVDDLLNADKKYVINFIYR